MSSAARTPWWREPDRRAWNALAAAGAGWMLDAMDVSLYLFALNHPEIQGPLNLTAPHPVTNREFTKAIGHALHRPTVMPIPGALLKVALGEMSQILRQGQNVLPAKALKAGYVFSFPSLPEALSDLVQPSSVPRALPVSGASHP